MNQRTRSRILLLLVAAALALIGAASARQARRVPASEAAALRSHADAPPAEASSLRLEEWKLHRALQGASDEARYREALSEQAPRDDSR
jgi:hypothetical protein